MLFQSTLPVRGATFLFAKKYLQNLSFNPRSPCGERRLFICYYWVLMYVSIHAPRAGSDQQNVFCSSFMRCFNPRSPCGERLLQMKKSVLTNAFQSTLPVRGATR